MRLVVLMALGACGPGLAHSQTPIESKNIDQLLRVGVTNGGLWFDDASCASQFGRAGEVAAAQLPAFAKCLAALNLRPSERKDALGDVQVYTYGNFEVEARVVDELDGPRLVWIGFASRTDASEPPTITAETLESLRTSGTPDGPVDPGLASTLLSKAEYSWLKICLDDTGNVTKVVPYESTSAEAKAVFMDATQRWHFKPFTVADQPVPACAMVRPAYPSGSAPDPEALPLPLPPPDPEEGPPLVLAPGANAIEGKRIKGEKLITPDIETRKAIERHHNERIIGQFRVCLSKHGTVKSVLPLRSTGYAAYDRKLLAAMKDWVYSPYTVDGQPVPVCTGVNFIYAQG